MIGGAGGVALKVATPPGVMGTMTGSSNGKFLSLSSEDDSFSTRKKNTHKHKQVKLVNSNFKCVQLSYDIHPT